MADQPRPDWLDSVEWMQSLLQSGSFSTSSRPIFLGQVTDPDEAWTIIQQALTDEELQQFIGFSIAQATTFWPEDQVPAPLVDEEQAETDLVQATIDWYNTHENFGAGWAQPGRGAEGEPVVYHRDAQTGVLVEAKLLPSPDADPPAEEMGVNTSPEAQVVTDSGQVNTREQTFPEAEPPHLGDDIPAEISFEQFQEYMQNPEWLQSLIARNMFEESQIQDGEIDLTVPYEQFREFMGGGALPFGGAQLGGVTGSPELAQALIEYMRTGDPALVEQAIPIEPLYNAGDQWNMFNSMSAEDIAAIQAKMIQKGWVAKGNVRLGYWDSYMAQQMAGLMAMADSKGTLWEMELDAMPDSLNPNGTNVDPYTRSVYREPDWDTMTEQVYADMAAILGRDPLPWELELFAKRLSGNYRDRHEAIEDANELDYNAQQRSFTEFQGISPDLSPEELEELGIDPNSTARPDYTGLPMPLSRVLQGAANVADTVHARQGTEVVQQVDPIASMRARMREMFANEIALGKKQESMQQIGRVLQSSLTGLERYVGGG